MRCCRAFRRLESFEDGPSDLRGGDGPIAVERATGLASVTESYMIALAATAGVGMNDDYNAARQAGVGADTAKRQGRAANGHRSWVPMGRAAKSAGPHRRYRNPRDGEGRPRCGCGVGREPQPATPEPCTREPRSNYQRRIARFAATSDAQSGIGHAAHVRGHGIEVIADLPVGDNLHDHLFVPMSYRAPGGRSASQRSFVRTAVRECVRPRSTHLAHTPVRGCGLRQQRDPDGH